MNVALGAVRTSALAFDMKRPVRNAKSEWQRREGVLVHVSAEGETGVGEASPLPGFAVDSLAETSAALARMATSLPGRVLALEGDGLSVVDAILAGERLPPSARFALETALLDLRARIRKVPLWAEICATARPEAVPISALLVGDDAHALRSEAEAAHARGIRTGKVKLGRAGQLKHELAMAQRLRGELGEGFGLRFDANGGWTLEEAKIAIPVLTELGAEMLEEPVAGDDFAALEPGPLRLGLDESLTSRSDMQIEGLLQSRRARAIVIKLSVVGGFVNAQRLAQLARKWECPAVVTHAFEGPIATAAAAAFAISLPSHPMAAGLDVRSYTECRSTHPIRFSTVEPWTEPGLLVG